MSRETRNVGFTFLLALAIVTTVSTSGKLLKEKLQAQAADVQATLLVCR